MKSLGKMCFKIILKVTKNEDFTLSLEDIFFEKRQGGVKLIPPLLPTSRFRVKTVLVTIVANSEKMKMKKSQLPNFWKFHFPLQKMGWDWEGVESMRIHLKICILIFDSICKFLLDHFDF